MKTVVVLAMHGTPPNDFPKDEMSEFFSLHALLESTGEWQGERLKNRHSELDHAIRNWPRKAKNDPF